MAPVTRAVARSLILSVVIVESQSRLAAPSIVAVVMAPLVTTEAVSFAVSVVMAESSAKAPPPSIATVASVQPSDVRTEPPRIVIVAYWLVSPGNADTSTTPPSTSSVLDEWLPASMTAPKSVSSGEPVL